MDLPEKGMAPPRTNKSGLPISSASRNATTGSFPRTGSLRSYDTGRNTRPRRGRQNADRRAIFSAENAVRPIRAERLSKSNAIWKACRSSLRKEMGSHQSPFRSARLPLPSKMRPADRKSLRLSRLICIIAVSRKCITVCMWSQALNETSWPSSRTTMRRARVSLSPSFASSCMSFIRNGRRSWTVSPSSRLERDLGIDSLGRTELILRIERSFRVRLPGAAATARRKQSAISFTRWNRRIPGVRSPRRLPRRQPLPLVPAADRSADADGSAGVARSPPS